jgi:predicted N-acetyltransferase YhbS
LGRFDCTNEALNSWLANSARRVSDDGAAKVQVWTPPRSRDVMAYYAITPTVVAKAELTSKQARGLRQVPGYLIAKLALHRKLHGQGLGGELLYDAIQHLVDVADQGGGRVIVVDAIDDRAAAFYQHHGFTPVKETERRLVMTVADARRSMGTTSLTLTPDQQMGLVSMIYKDRDGKSMPFAAEAVEARSIARKLMEKAAESEASNDLNASIDLHAVVVEALGRDPFAS